MSHSTVPVCKPWMITFEQRLSKEVENSHPITCPWCCSRDRGIPIGVFLRTVVECGFHKNTLKNNPRAVEMAQQIRVPDCSCTGPRFASQCPHGSAQQSVSSSSGYRMPSSGPIGIACMLCEDKYAGRTPVHIKITHKTLKKKERKVILERCSKAEQMAPSQSPRGFLSTCLASLSLSHCLLLIVTFHFMGLALPVFLLDKSFPQKCSQSVLD